MRLTTLVASKALRVDGSEIQTQLTYPTHKENLLHRIVMRLNHL